MKRVYSIEEVINAAHETPLRNVYYLFEVDDDERLNKIFQKYYQGENKINKLKFGIRSGEVRHTINVHGGQSEFDKGQYPVYYSDFLLIPEIINSADTIKESHDTNDGNKAVMYIKEIGHTYFCVQQIIDNDKILLLTLKTMYKKPLK